MYRPERIRSLLFRISTEFIVEHWTGNSRVTATRIEMSRDLKKAVIYVIISPESDENRAMRELSGLRLKLYNEVAGKLKTRFTPRFEFKIDEGEKSRRKIEELLAKIKK